jgi:hypothetical protein
MKDRKSFVAGLLAGLAPPSVFEVSKYPSLQGTDMSRMRSDVERVGKQFSTVIDRENDEKAKPAAASD